MLKKIALLSIFSLALGLIGCDMRTDLEKQLQATYDVSRGKGACFFIPESNNLPYTTKQVDKKDYGNFQGNKLVNERFDTYATIGLFQKEKISENDDMDTYQYSLTELGKQFITSHGFCSGNIYIKKIDEITDMGTTETGAKIKQVYFKYQIENYPKWFIENEKLIRNNFQTTILSNGSAYITLIDDGEKPFFDEKQRYFSFGYFVYKFNR